MDGHSYFQHNWEPNFSCDYEERLGRIGDGGKWVCDPYKIAEAKECNVLSIGSASEFSFEKAMHKLNPRCRIHTFDHTIIPTGVPPYVRFHAVGIGAEDKGNIHTLTNILDIAGYKDKRIDILKIDCEACEFEIFPDFFKAFFHQILIEVHYIDGRKSDAMMQAMHDFGYVIFHKESNTFGCNGDCIEYAFLRTNFTVKAVK
jgi:hypothetical protein